MPTWTLIHQRDGLPVCLARDDGSPEAPPADLADYIERAYGPWTLGPATRPLAAEGVEWPMLCDPDGWTGCPGTMSYMDAVPIQMVTGEERMTPGWRCDQCGEIDVPGIKIRTRTVVGYRQE